MNDPPSWLTFVPVLSALVSVGGAALAWWNARRSGAIADRQHAVAYAADLSKWGADMLESYRLASGSFEEKLDTKEAFERIKKAGNNFIFLFDRLALLIPNSDSELAREVVTVCEMAKAEVLLLARVGSNTSAEKFDESRTRFLGHLRSEMGVKKRYIDARNYLK